MSIFQPIVKAGEFVAMQTAAIIYGNRKSEVEHAKLARRAFEASLTFPNDRGGYVWREKKEKPIVNPTPDEAFARLKAAYLAGPLPTSTGHRKPTRGRSKRKRIIGVRVWGKEYAFNGGEACIFDPALVGEIINSITVMPA